VDAICYIPKSLCKSRRLLSINKSSQQLQNYSTALYVSILQVMGHILEHYTHNPLMKAVTVVVGQDRFQATLAAKIEAINECSKAIDDEAQICSQELGNNTNQILRVVAKDVKIGQEKIQRLGENIEFHGKENHAASEIIIAGNLQIQQGQRRTEAKIDTVAQTTIEGLTSIKNIFLDVAKLKELIMECKRTPFMNFIVPAYAEY
jgi:hypothetical protein